MEQENACASLHRLEQETQVDSDSDEFNDLILLRAVAWLGGQYN